MRLTLLVSLATNPNFLDTVYCFLRVMLQWVVVGWRAVHGGQ